MRHNDYNNGNMDDQSLERGAALGGASLDTSLAHVGAADGLNGYSAPGAMTLRRPYGEQLEDGIDLVGILNMVRRRLKPILAIFFTVLALGAFITWKTPRVYQAAATVVIDVAAKGNSADPMSILLSQPTTSLDTEIAVVLSKPVLNAALTKISQFDRDQIEKFSGNKDGKTNATDLLVPGAVAATTTGDANVITISSWTYNPKTSANLSKAIAEAYIAYDLAKKQAKAGGGAEFILSQKEQVYAKLNKARMALKRFQEQHKTVNSEEETKAKIAQLSVVTTDLRAAETERVAGRAQLENLQSLLKTLSPIIPGGATVVQSETAGALKSKLTALEISRYDARNEYAPDSPEVKSLDAQIAELRRRLQGEAERQIGTETTTGNPVHTSTLQTITQTQGQVWAAEARLRALQVAAAQAQAELAALPGTSYGLNKIATEVAIQQAAYQTLSQNYQDLLVKARSTLSDASILSPPDVPKQAAYPRKIKNMLVITVLGLLLALGWASVAERLDNKVHSEEEAEAVVRRPVLAQVPALKELAQQSLMAKLDKPTPLLESFRMLRTNLTFSALDKPIRSVAITSSLPGEGKSTSALNLAIVTAMSGKQVILVDGDLRRPSIHRLLEIPNKVGFTSVVSGAVSLDDALCATRVPGLRALTSGPIPPDPPELLSSKAARTCLSQLVEQADLVVIDCPPALAMADAQIIASMSDAIIMVVSSQDVGKQEIARTSELLFQTGARFLGAILTKVTGDFTGYHKYGYYGDYLSGAAAEHNGAAKTEDAHAQLTGKES